MKNKLKIHKKLQFKKKAHKNNEKRIVLDC